MENNNIPGDRDAISSFYNTFKKKQIMTGVNLRHYMVFNKCVRAGLKRDHQILEIGCGIGTFTQLTSRYLTKGSILATDISNESIEEAKKRIPVSRKVNFMVSDMSDFTSDTKFDFVVMVDVLEHIPFDQYDQLFSIINKCTHENSIFAINIPHPDIIRYFRTNRPEQLQIIDNSVDMDYLSGKIYNHNFILTSFSTYCVHNEDNDYAFITFAKESKKKEFNRIPKIKVIKRKLVYRIKYLITLYLKG